MNFTKLQVHLMIRCGACCCGCNRWQLGERISND
uniref:Uncharacterized protein n=1 Tax=Arundo donax TaxID=35708 RepID=A0A0A9AFT2_ARUDO